MAVCCNPDESVVNNWACIETGCGTGTCESGEKYVKVIPAGTSQQKFLRLPGSDTSLEYGMPYYDDSAWNLENAPWMHSSPWPYGHYPLPPGFINVYGSNIFSGNYRYWVRNTFTAVSNQKYAVMIMTDNSPTLIVNNTVVIVDKTDTARGEYFDITDYLITGINHIAVCCWEFGGGSYLDYEVMCMCENNLCRLPTLTGTVAVASTYNASVNINACSGLTFDRYALRGAPSWMSVNNSGIISYTPTETGYLKDVIVIGTNAQGIVQPAYFDITI